MRAFSIAMAMAVATAVMGCRSHKEVALPEKTVSKVEKVTEVRWDTVYLSVPAQSAEAVTLDSVSLLETDFAVSEARILPNGAIHHTLKNKEKDIPQAVAVTETRTDSIVEREVSVPVYIKEEPGKWERFKSSAFWWLAGMIVVVVAVWIRKYILKIADIR